MHGYRPTGGPRQQACMAMGQLARRHLGPSTDGSDVVVL